MPESKDESIEPLNFFRSEAKIRATESLLCTVVPNLANDISVKTFFHPVKTTSVKIDKSEEYFFFAS